MWDHCGKKHKHITLSEGEWLSWLSELTVQFSNPRRTSCSDESLLFPKALKEMKLKNLDRGICCEIHVKVIFSLLPSLHRLVPQDLSIAITASYQKPTYSP